MAAVRVPLFRDDVDGARWPANEQMAVCNTRRSCSSSPAPPACSHQLISTFCVSPASCTSRRAQVHLHLPRTLRHDSAAVQPMAARAYHATRLDSSDQAAVLVSGTVGWRPETAWFGVQLLHYTSRAAEPLRAKGPTRYRLETVLPCYCKIRRGRSSRTVRRQSHAFESRKCASVPRVGTGPPDRRVCASGVGYDFVGVTF